MDCTEVLLTFNLVVSMIVFICVVKHMQLRNKEMKKKRRQEYKNECIRLRKTKLQIERQTELQTENDRGRIKEGNQIVDQTVEHFIPYKKIDTLTKAYYHKDGGRNKQSNFRYGDITREKIIQPFCELSPAYNKKLNDIQVNYKNTYRGCNLVEDTPTYDYCKNKRWPIDAIQYNSPVNDVKQMTFSLDV